MSSAGSWASSAAGAAAQTAASVDSAETPVPGYAEAIAEAVEHYSAGRWLDAQRAFARAHALQPSARTLRGLGLSAYYLGQYAAAREAFEQALADPRRPLPAPQRAEIERLLPTAVRESGGEQQPLDVAPGPAAASAVDMNAAVPAPAVAANAPAAVSTPPAPAIARPAAPAITSAPHAERGGRLLTWIAAAAVPVFAGSAAALWFTGQDKHDAIERACRRDGCDRQEAERRVADAHLAAHETWTTVALAASGVALATSLLLFVIEAPDEHERADEARVGITVDGASLRARF